MNAIPEWLMPLGRQDVPLCDMLVDLLPWYGTTVQFVYEYPILTLH